MIDLYEHDISIHALREEGDFSMMFFLSLHTKFLSTPSVRRATLERRAYSPYALPFLSTPSARRATITKRRWNRQRKIFLSTPSARRATTRKRWSRFILGISIHALREEGDPEPGTPAWQQLVFLSTPSVRRATVLADLPAVGLVISIHALREEGDFTRAETGSGGAHFYPRPP